MRFQNDLDFLTLMFIGLNLIAWAIFGPTSADLAGRGAVGFYREYGGVIGGFLSLVTGVLAVVAAYITVAQMRESDRQQEARHAAMLYQNQWQSMKKARRWYREVHQIVQTGIRALNDLDADLLKSRQEEVAPGFNAEFDHLNNTFKMVRAALDGLPDKDLALDYIADRGEECWRTYNDQVNVAAGLNPVANRLFDELEGVSVNGNRYVLNIARARGFIAELVGTSNELLVILQHEIDTIVRSAELLSTKAETR